MKPLLPGSIIALCLLAAGSASAAVARDTTVELSATTTNSPPGITLNWTPLSGGVYATSVTVARKDLGAASWGSATALATNAVSYVDASVNAGMAYEYKVTRVRSDGVTAYGYIAAGIELPAVHDRGTAVVLVDAALAPLAASEIDRFTFDLIGDGWHVIRHDVPRTNTVPDVRALIQADRQAEATVKTVVILGSVPQPYSGNINPDGHPDHQGAWPTDAYYADVDGTWTDTTISNVVASGTRNDNVPGDGKFDQSYPPNTLELEVGRADFTGMTSFAASGESTTSTEARLLRRYLEKDHAWRQGQLPAPARGVIDDNFGYFGGEAFAASGWRNYAALVNSTNVVAADWFGTLGVNPYLLAYGCGGGSSTSAGGVGNTTDFATRNSLGIFTFLFGSYFGDWGYANNFLRAPLASAGYGLTCGWAGRPHWFIHQMGLGQTIGYCALQTANNSSLYTPGNYGARMIHVGLMGDPTLRLHVVAPPPQLTATADDPSVLLGWNASADAGQAGFLGYHVYRADTVEGPWTRLTTDAITDTQYTDASPLASAVYMVRALRRQPTNSGSYENLSQGAFVAIPNTPPTLSAIADQVTNEDTISAPSSFTIGDAETPADALSVTATASNTALVSFGNVVIEGTGPSRTVKVVPAPNANGSSVITVTVSDGFASASTNFTVTVNAVNDTPVANSQSVTTDEDTPKAITLTGSDVEGSPLNYIVTTTPTNGTLSGTAPALTYTPYPNINGSDNFKFTVNDGVLTSSVATVTITITAVNDPPVASNQTVTAMESIATVITLTGSDVDNSSLTFLLGTPPAHGNLTGTAPDLTYTSDNPYTGPDSFTFRVTDGTLTSEVATVSINVIPLDTDGDGMPDAWEQLYDADPTNMVAAADLDGDGISSLLEYALDLDPTIPDVTGLPTLVPGAVPGTFEFTFSRARAELNYEVQFSLDMVGWDTIATNPGNTGEAVTVTFTPEPVALSGFVRLKVTHP